MHFYGIDGLAYILYWAFGGSKVDIRIGRRHKTTELLRRDVMKGRKRRYPGRCVYGRDIHLYSIDSSLVKGRR